MPFIFTHGDRRLDLEDLPLDAWIKIQEATGLTWPEVLTAKVLGDAKIASSVVAQCAAHLGIEVPTLTLRSMLDAITIEVAENIPEQFNDGVPDPKAPASEPATT